MLTLLVVTTGDLEEVTLEFVTEGVTRDLRTIFPISHSILALLIETSVCVCACMCGRRIIPKPSRFDPPLSHPHTHTQTHDIVKKKKRIKRQC